MKKAKTTIVILMGLLLLTLALTGCADFLKPADADETGTAGVTSADTGDTSAVESTEEAKEITTEKAVVTTEKTTEEESKVVTTVSEETTSPETEQLPPEDADGKFSFAVIPDTQQEVVSDAAKNKYFLNRSQWIVNNQEKYDIRYVIHSGDVVNWGNEDEDQLVIASDAMKVLDDAGIPVIYSLGNHDTAAVGVGGSAADPANTKTRVRDTTAFNKYFNLTRYPDLVPKDSGKIDNTYTIFEACGTKWLLLSLELWPRTEVITWANTVVASHPDCNVIVSTHSYMNSDGSIKQDNGGYGANSGQYLFDNLIKKYENIKMVVCGHVGQSKTRVDYGVNGNKIVSVVACFHANDRNPLYILDVDVKNGKLNGSFFSPINNSNMSQYNFSFSGMTFVK